jgi:hypothetical protein
VAAVGFGSAGACEMLAWVGTGRPSLRVSSSFGSSSKDITLGALSFPLDLDKDPNHEEPVGDGFGVVFDLVDCVVGNGILSV